MAWLGTFAPLVAAEPTLPVLVSGPGVGASGPIATGPIEVRGGAVATSTTVLELREPVLEGLVFSIRGLVAYDEVEGEGFLEMWTHFPDGSQYFSRTLAEVGPMAKVRGSSKARPFELPFRSEAGLPPPAKLVLNVVLPAGGRVELRDVRYEGRATPQRDGASSPPTWWSERTGGLLGGALGMVVGVVAAVAGALCAAGAGRRAATAALFALLALGVAAMLAGLASLTLRQPYHVWYPLLLCGALALPLGALGLAGARRRFEAIELRRMRALDVR